MVSHSRLHRPVANGSGDGDMRNTPNLPETFAGGTFGLPLVVARLVRMADSNSPTEAAIAKSKLLSKGYFLDRIGVLWDKDKVPDFAKDETYEQH